MSEKDIFGVEVKQARAATIARRERQARDAQDMQAHLSEVVRVNYGGSIAEEMARMAEARRIQRVSDAHSERVRHQEQYLQSLLTRFVDNSIGFPVADENIHPSWLADPGAALTDDGAYDAAVGCRMVAVDNGVVCQADESTAIIEESKRLGLPFRWVDMRADGDRYPPKWLKSERTEGKETREQWSERKKAELCDQLTSQIKSRMREWPSRHGVPMVVDVYEFKGIFTVYLKEGA